MTALTRALVFYVAAGATLALLVRLVGVRWWQTGVGRHLTAMVAALAAAFVLLAVSLLGVGLPGWVWPVALAAIAVAVTWRLVLELRRPR